MKYRKKPVIIEAFKWTADEDQLEDPIWICEAIRKGEAWIDRDRHGGIITMKIKTLEGLMRANIGDYIIQGVNGEIYPCKPDIFEKTYEKVEGE